MINGRGKKHSFCLFVIGMNQWCFLAHDQTSWCAHTNFSKWKITYISVSHPTMASEVLECGRSWTGLFCNLIWRFIKKCWSFPCSGWVSTAWKWPTFFLLRSADESHLYRFFFFLSKLSFSFKSPSFIYRF